MRLEKFEHHTFEEMSEFLKEVVRASEAERVSLKEVKGGVFDAFFAGGSRSVCHPAFFMTRNARRNFQRSALEAIEKFLKARGEW